MSTKFAKCVIYAGAAIVAAALIVGLIFGFNSGMDITGGTVITIRQPIDVSVSEFEKELKAMPETAGKLDVIISDATQESAIFIAKVQKLTVSLDEFKTALDEKFVDPVGNEEVAIVYECDNFKQLFGFKEALMPALALICAAIGAALYLLFRFGWKTAVSVITGTLASPLILIALVTIFRVEVNKPIISACYFSAVIALLLATAAEVISGYRDRTISARDVTREEIRTGSAKESAGYAVMALAGLAVMFIIGMIWQTRLMRALFIACGIGCAVAVFIAYWAEFGLKKLLEDR